MKKTVVTLLAVAALLMATGEAKAQLYVGVGFLNSTEITRYTNNDPKFTENMGGFYVGASYNFNLVGGLGFAPGFYLDGLFQTVNYKEDPLHYQKTFGPGFSFSNGIYRELGLNIPLNLTYKFEINENVKIAVYGGVVGQFVPLAHTTYREGVITPVGIVVGPRGGRVFYATKGDTYKYDHLWSSNADMRPFNMYAGGGVAVQLGDIQIMVGYDHSLLNVSRIEGERTGRSQIKVGVNFTIGED